jgi:2-oxoglutarate/2-oxoacid ferredoxin oxidoreductase subunit alpha
MSALPAEKATEQLPEATILFAGDSGDGMQLTGSQFTLATAFARNDLATLPDFPAEIRAPAGTTYGVSGFQLHFGSVQIRTPGDEVDMLVAMNPAALKVNLSRVRSGGTILVNADAFDRRSLDLAKYDRNPLEDGSLDGFQVIRVELTSLTHEALKDFGLDKKTVDRSKNMFALGLSLWLYSRPIEPAMDWIRRKFASKPDILEANVHLLKKGYHFGETTEVFSHRYEVRPAALQPGIYRAVRGAEAMALGLLAAAKRSGLKLFYGSYPITPASDLLHELSRHKNFGVTTFQAEDEIAAIGAAIGASFGGSLGITGTSGPGVALKGEAIGLAVMTELPLLVVNVQRGGPSTGLPTKTEQSDLLQALYGRNGEAPVPVIAASTPGDAFYATYEAARIAVRYMTPVILLSDGYLANGSEPWPIPDVSTLPSFDVSFAREPNKNVEGEPVFMPYLRDPETLARPWATPGTAGLEHRIGGLEKQAETGNVSYDPANHEYMIRTRAAKVARIATEIPPTDVFGDAEGDLLVIGWGSTRGAIEAAIDRQRARATRRKHPPPLSESASVGPRADIRPVRKLDRP